MLNTNGHIARKIITANAKGGQFMTVQFVKKDGTLRTMNCRTGVKTHLKGGSSTTAHKDNLLTVWDRKSKQYRSVNLNTVQSIHCAGKKFTF